MDRRCEFSVVREVGLRIAGQRPLRKLETAYCKLWYFEKLIEPGGQGCCQMPQQPHNLEELGTENLEDSPLCL